MYFSDQNLEKLNKTQTEVASKCELLVESYLNRDYKDSRAREFAKHGFSRRLKTLARRIDSVFRILPPDRTDLPSCEEIYDGMMNIQAFVFNAFGILDNLAWIWVQEKSVRNKDGSQIHKRKVGLGKKYKLVRSSLSTEFQKYLKGKDKWLDHLEDFRHALAHRIPLYIPPYIIPKDKKADYRQLDDRITEAGKRGDIAECDRLKAERDALCMFVPWVTHSFGESAPHIEFHTQLLTDFLAIEEVSQKMLEELDR
jgi:hypothetical protein